MPPAPLPSFPRGLWGGREGPAPAPHRRRGCGTRLPHKGTGARQVLVPSPLSAPARGAAAGGCDGGKEGSAPRSRFPPCLRRPRGQGHEGGVLRGGGEEGAALVPERGAWLSSSRSRPPRVPAAGSAGGEGAGSGAGVSARAGGGGVTSPPPGAGRGAPSPPRPSPPAAGTGAGPGRGAHGQRDRRSERRGIRSGSRAELPAGTLLPLLGGLGDRGGWP